MDTDKFIRIAKQVIAHELNGLKLLVNSIDQNFLKALELLANTKGRIVVSGIGKSGIIARKLAATFSSTGSPSYFVHPVEASHGDLGMIHHDDIMLILSNGGESLELFDLVNYAKSAEIPIIAMVGRASSTLARSSNVVLSLPEISEASHIKAPTTSTTMMLALGDALAVALIEHKQFSLDHYKTLHPGGRLGAGMLVVKDIMYVGTRLPQIYIHTKMPEALIEMTAKSLGCVVVIDDALRVLGIITDGDLRRHASKNFLDMTIEEVMTKSPLLIDKDLKVIDALEIMNKKSITSLVVAAEGKLAGLIHIHDCLRVGLEAINSDDENR